MRMHESDKKRSEMNSMRLDSVFLGILFVVSLILTGCPGDDGNGQEGQGEGQVVVESVFPTSGPVEGGNRVDIFGTFGIIETVEEAEETYTVTFGSEPAEFLVDVTVNAVAYAGALYVTAPPQDFLDETPVEVTVTNINDVSNFDSTTYVYTVGR